MAVKTFTTGEVLTASDTNTYLANSGLVFVKSQAIGTAVSTVTVTSAFSSTYDAYRICLYGVSCSAVTPQLRFAFGAGAANHYGTLFYDNYIGTNAYVRSNAGNYLTVGVGDGAKSTQTEFDVFAPNLAQRTNLTGTFGGAYSGWFGGVDISSTVFTDFTFSLSSGTYSDGTIVVYGYRKA